MNGKTAKRWPQRLAGALCLLAATLTATAADDTLTVGVTENDAAPSMIFSYSPQPQLDGGVWKDLLDSIGHQLGQRVEYLPLARKRMDSYLQNGQIDMVCNTNPAWWEAPERFHWSLPLSEQVERFVSPLTLHERITSLSQLNGRRIGTVIGYHYPALAYAFAHGAQRIDQQQANLQLRAAASGRGACIVTDDPYLYFARLTQWWRREHALAVPAAVHSTASVHPTAELAQGVDVGAFAVIGAGVRIGSGARVGAHCVLGEHVHVGAQLLELFLVRHPKALLLVHDHEAEVLELGRFGEDRMGADHKVNLTVLQPLSGLGGLLGCDQP